MALINGKAYDYTQIIVNIMGVPITGVTEINYDEEQEKVNVMGTGKRAHSRGHGAISSSASIGLSMNEVEKIRDAAVSAGSADGSLLALEPFDILVVYGNSQRPITHKLKDCEFTKDGGGGSEGDTDINKVYDLIISNVQYR